MRFKASVLSTLSRRRRQAEGEAGYPHPAPDPHAGSEPAPAVSLVPPRKQSADTSDSDDVVSWRMQRKAPQACKGSAASSRSSSSGTEGPKREPTGDRTLTAGAQSSLQRNAQGTVPRSQVAAKEGAIFPRSGPGAGEGRAGPAVTPAQSEREAATSSPRQEQHSSSLPVRGVPGILQFGAAAHLQSAVSSSPPARSRPALGSRPRPASPPSSEQHSQMHKQQARAHLIHRQPSTREDPRSAEGPSSHASLGGLAVRAEPPAGSRQRQQGRPGDGLMAQSLESPWAAPNATTPPDSPGNVHTARGSLGVQPVRYSTDGALGSRVFSGHGAVDPGAKPRARASYSGRDALEERRQRSHSGTPEPSSPGKNSNLGASVGTSADDGTGAKSAHALLPRMGPVGDQIEQSLPNSGTTALPLLHSPKGPGAARARDSLSESAYQQQQPDRHRNLEAHSVRWDAGEPGPGLGQQWRAARDSSTHAEAHTTAWASFGVPEAHTPSEQRRAQTYGGDSSPYSQVWPTRAAASTPGGHDLRHQQPSTSASFPFSGHAATTPHWQAPLQAAATPEARPAAPPAYTPLGAMATPDLAAWPLHVSPAPSSSAMRLGAHSRTLVVGDGEEVGIQLLPRRYYPLTGLPCLNATNVGVCQVNKFRACNALTKLAMRCHTRRSWLPRPQYRTLARSGPTSWQATPPPRPAPAPTTSPPSPRSRSSWTRSCGTWQRCGPHPAPRPPPCPPPPGTAGPAAAAEGPPPRCPRLCRPARSCIWPLGQ